MPATDRKLRVFLCHASQDKPVVRELYQRLLAEGWIDPWLDEEKLLAGQKWEIEISQKVRDADIVLVCLSGSSVTKEGYVQKEIKLALDIANEKPEESIYIIPVRLEECNVPLRLRELHWIDLFKDMGSDKLKKSLVTRAENVGVNHKYRKNLDNSLGFLVNYASTLRENYNTRTEWANSSFEWIINLPAIQKGKVGKLLFERWCSEKGIHFEKINDSVSDFVINGFKFSIKFSTLWVEGSYKFQQIRKSGYDFVVCFGISPEDAHCWVIDRSSLGKYMKFIAEDRSGYETMWLAINPHENDAWVSEFGGNLEKAYQVLKRSIS